MATYRSSVSSRRVMGFIPFWLLMGIIAFLILYPLLIVTFTAFKTEADLARNPLGFPQAWSTANFERAWRDAKMGDLMRNSLIVSTGVVLGGVLLSAMGGFALARLNFFGRSIVPVLLVIGLVLPFETLMIPLFYTFRPLGILNTYWAMILPQIGLGLPFGILLLRGFIGELPQDYFDAAEMDGCNLLQQFRYLVLPLSRPALIALGVFLFLWSWNQYLVALVMIQNPNLRTIPLGLSFFVGRFETSYTALAAAAVVAALPIVILYVIFNRQILQANLYGALK